MPENDLPVPTAHAPLPRREKLRILSGMRALEGSARTFVAEIARKARHARGRIDDDVYGIIRITLDLLRDSGGVPPPILFAVTHYETGRVEQICFLPPGVCRVPPGGEILTNDPRFQPPRPLGPDRARLRGGHAGRETGREQGRIEG